MCRCVCVCFWVCVFVCVYLCVYRHWQQLLVALSQAARQLRVLLPRCVRHVPTLAPPDQNRRALAAEVVAINHNHVASHPLAVGRVHGALVAAAGDACDAGQRVTDQLGLCVCTSRC